MIFITLGSQKFQFNRLLMAVDSLCAQGALCDEIVAQTGYSDYQTQHFVSTPFMDREVFSATLARADIIITHGGTGTIINAVNQGKKVVAMARLAQYGEHVDDHQRQIIQRFSEMNLICPCDDKDALGDAIETVKRRHYDRYVSNTHTIINSIQSYIESLA